MDKYEVNWETDSVKKYGELIICLKEDRIDWIIPGTYEFTNPIVHNLSSRIEMNDEESTLIGIPDQYEIYLILKGFAERIRDDKWFTDPEKSKSEFSKLRELQRLCIDLGLMTTQ